MNTEARPILKWAGGKTQLLPEILPIIEGRTFKTYFEPFIGGGAVFFSTHSRFQSAVINDWNPELTNLYTVVRDDPESLIEALKEHKIGYDASSETYFYGLREKQPRDLTPLQRAARMVLLNKTCFNGLYRENRKGGFNVPWGKFKNPSIFDPETIRACSKALQSKTILNGDFAQAVATASAGDLVYFDPPYVPASVTSDFTAYTSKGFGMKDQEELARIFKTLVNRGVMTILSNSDVPSVRALYGEFTIKAVTAKRNINSKASKRGPVGEVLVIGDPTLATVSPSSVVSESEAFPPE